MPATRLVVVDPGHFHAALVQQRRYPNVSPEAHVYAPLGPELTDYLGRIARYNAAAGADWRLRIHAGPDFLERFREEPAGAVAIFSGRNRGKIERIRMALDAGMHVLADKPVIIRRDDLPALAAAVDIAAAQGLVFCDLMTGRCDPIGAILQGLARDPDVFGEPQDVVVESVHHIMKEVSGRPNLRPAWYFDIEEQGEGIADIGTHLVDRVHETLFPGVALDWRSDIAVEAASRWPTMLSLDRFRAVTGESQWPEFLAPYLKGGDFEYFCNMRAQYRVRGVGVSWRRAGTGRRRRAGTTRIRRRTGAAGRGWNCARVRRRATGRNFTSLPSAISPPRSTAGSRRCRRPFRGSASTRTKTAGGFRFRRHCGSATTQNSRCLPSGSSTTWTIRAACRAGKDRTCWRNTPSVPKRSR